MPKKKDKMFQVENPAKVSLEQIKESLLRVGMTEEAVAFKAANTLKLLNTLVSEEYQPEIDFYLQNQKASDSECGKYIERSMTFHFNSFFDALVTYVMIKLDKEGLI